MVIIHLLEFKELQIEWVPSNFSRSKGFKLDGCHPSPLDLIGRCFPSYLIAKINSKWLAAIHPLSCKEVRIGWLLSTFSSLKRLQIVGCYPTSLAQRDLERVASSQLFVLCRQSGLEMVFTLTFPMGFGIIPAL